MRDRRRTKARRLSPVFHIFSEGEKTEPNYISRYKNLFYVNIVAVKVEKTEKNKPVQLVEDVVTFAIESWRTISLARQSLR